MLRIAAYLLSWFATVIAVVAFAARYVPVVNHALLFLAALSPYLTLAASLTAAAVLFSRSRRLAAAALVPAVLAVAVQVPLFTGSGDPGADTVAVRILTANLKEGSADPAPLAALARERADVVVVQELTNDLFDDLSGRMTDFPFRAIAAEPYAAGVGIWSRYPIEQSGGDSRYRLGMITASLRVPGVTPLLTVLTTHLMGPWPQPIDEWRAEIAALPGTLAALAGAAGPRSVVVAGDFNATADMEPFRRLLGHGFRSAAEQAGAGLVRTFPADGPTPPLIGIDHVLTRNAGVSEVATVRVPGSDHLGLTATVHLPRRVNTG